MAFFKDGKGNVKGKRGKFDVLEVQSILAQNSLIMNMQGGITLASYTVATLPAAADNAGKLVYCSNGAAGSPCLAYSNGTSWLQIALGAAVAAA